LGIIFKVNNRCNTCIKKLKPILTFAGALYSHQPIIEKRTHRYLQDNTVFEYGRNYFKPSDYKFPLVAKRH